MTAYSSLTDLDPRLPNGMPGCYTVGLSGGCGGSCPVLQSGKCETQDEMEPALSPELQVLVGSYWLREQVQTAMERRS